MDRTANGLIEGPVNLKLKTYQINITGDNFMTVLSIHDNEEFRISTQVDHSKSVKQMPFNNFKFKLYLSFQFFKYFTPTKTSGPQLGCEDLEYLIVKVIVILPNRI